MKKLISFMYTWARKLNDISALLSFNPARIFKRGANKVIGRKLGKVYRK